jgi:hypothetical protein
LSRSVRTVVVQGGADRQIGGGRRNDGRRTLGSMAVSWDGANVNCDGPDCGASERLPATLLENPVRRHEDWLVGRAWSTDGGSHYCPDHW